MVIFLQNGDTIDENTEKSFTKQFLAMAKTEEGETNFLSVIKGLRKRFLDVGIELLNSNKCITYGTFFNNNTEFINTSTLAYNTTDKYFYNSDVTYGITSNWNTGTEVCTSMWVNYDNYSNGGTQNEIRMTTGSYTVSWVRQPDDKVEHVWCRLSGWNSGSATRSISWKFYSSNNETAANWTELISRSDSHTANGGYTVTKGPYTFTSRDLEKYYRVQRTGYSLGPTDEIEIDVYPYISTKTYGVQNIVFDDITTTSDRKYLIIIPVTNKPLTYSEAAWNSDCLKVYIDSVLVDPYKILELEAGTKSVKIELGGYEQTIQPQLHGIIMMNFEVER